MINRSARLTAAFAAASALSTALLPGVPALAQVHRPNVIQRHPTASGVAAGVATHTALKMSARAKKRRGQRLNFAERHPTLSGIGAAVGTHHVIKHTTHP